jgi:hypothetical protein
MPFVPDVAGGESRAGVVSVWSGPTGLARPPGRIRLRLPRSAGAAPRVRKLDLLQIRPIEVADRVLEPTGSPCPRHLLRREETRGAVPQELPRRGISVHAPTLAPIEHQTTGDMARSRSTERGAPAPVAAVQTGRGFQSVCCVPSGSPTPGATEQHGLALALVEPAHRFAGGGSWLGSLASACAVSQHQAATSLGAKPTSGAGPQTRVGTRSALFG